MQKDLEKEVGRSLVQIDFRQEWYSGVTVHGVVMMVKMKKMVWTRLSGRPIGKEGKEKDQRKQRGRKQAKEGQWLDKEAKWGQVSAKKRVT